MPCQVQVVHSVPVSTWIGWPFLFVIVVAGMPRAIDQPRAREPIRIRIERLIAATRGPDQPPADQPLGGPRVLPDAIQPGPDSGAG